MVYNSVYLHLLTVLLQERLHLELDIEELRGAERGQQPLHCRPPSPPRQPLVHDQFNQFPS